MSDGLRNPMSIAADCTNVTVGVAAVETPLPVGATGKRTRFYALLATQELVDDSLIWFTPSDGSISVVADTGVMISFTTPLIIDFGGYTHVSHISSDAGQELCIAPLENQ